MPNKFAYIFKNDYLCTTKNNHDENNTFNNRIAPNGLFADAGSGTEALGI